MITAVDTNIFLDILIPNQTYIRSSIRKLEEASKGNQIIICEIVYTELASQFENQSDLKTFLFDTHIEIIWNNQESLFNAGKLWMEYLRQYPRKRYCPECGKQIEIFCPGCNYKFNTPRRILNDFIIGSHAKNFADSFLTRDRGFYRKYFSGITIL